MTARNSTPRIPRCVPAPDAETVVLRCSCGTLQEEPLDPDAIFRDAIRRVTCLFCGRVGAMSRATRST